jgi:hypothetical protein
MGGACSTYGGESCAYEALMGNPEEEKPFWRPRPLGDNIKMDLKDVVWDGVGWIGLAEDKDTWRALVKAVMNILLP